MFPLLKHQISFAKPAVSAFSVIRIFPGALLLFCSIAFGFGSGKVDGFKPIASGAAQQALPNAAGFVYLAEESLLIPGTPSRLTTYRIAENGATQSAEIVDDEVALFDEGRVDPTKTFAVLAPMMGKQFVVRRRNATSQIDGVFPPFVRVFFRYKESQRELYADLASAAPGPLSVMIEQVHAALSAPTKRPQQNIFVQSALLDAQTVTELRRDNLLRTVVPNELESAPVTALALQQPFKLIASTETAMRQDTFAVQLTSAQPVLDIQYGDIPFQLRFLKLHH